MSTNSYFEILIKENYDIIKRMTFKYPIPDEEKKDLLQDTLVKAYLNINKFEKGTNFRAWIYVIMRNTYINSFRKKKMYKFEPLDGIFDTFSDEHLHRDTKTELGRYSELLDKLSYKQRNAFILNAIGYKYDEISWMLNVPIGTVRSTIHLAKRHLKKMMANERI